MVTPDILVVDDDPDILEALSDLLVELGFNVVGRADGEQAFTWLDGGSSQPSLVLLDLFMPQLNGWELLRRMRADVRFQRLPVIVITATPTRRDGELARLGVDSVLPKPFDLERLVARIERYVPASR